MTKFCHLLKWSAGILWQYSGWDSKLSLPRAQIQSLVRELRFPKVCSVTKKKKKKKKGLWMCFGYLLSKEKSGILVIFLSWEMEYFLPYPQTKDVTVISDCNHHRRWALRKLRMWKYRILAPDSWGTYQRNDFSEPGFLHIPIHRKALNSLTWDIWLSFN